MNTSIIVAIIDGLLALLGIVVTAKVTQNRIISEIEKKQALQDAKNKEFETHLKSIDHKLDVHNGYAEKLGGMSADMKVMANEITHLKERL